MITNPSSHVLIFFRARIQYKAPTCKCANRPLQAMNHHNDNCRNLLAIFEPASMAEQEACEDSTKRAEFVFISVPSLYFICHRLTPVFILVGHLFALFRLINKRRQFFRRLVRKIAGHAQTRLVHFQLKVHFLAQSIQLGVQLQLRNVIWRIV